MNIRNYTHSFALLAILAFAGTAAAQGTATAPTLEMSANVVTTMSLTISTDTANGGTEVTSGAANEFALDFGDVNGFGLGTPATGVSVTVTGTNAVYTTPINLTPNFSGFDAGENATISRMAGASGEESIAREGASAATVSVLPETATSAIVNADDASLNTRYVGFSIARTEASGAKVATVIYSIVVD